MPDINYYQLSVTAAFEAEACHTRIEAIAAAYILQIQLARPKLDATEAKALGSLEADRDARVKDLASMRDRNIQLSIMYSNLHLAQHAARH